ncbi:hypothetical protein EMCRGX_G014524 [Ephydatia muelleri]
MAQEFLVLKCFSCETFQVIQVKKTNKWACKICNEKQSITKVYGRGSPSDCRKHVQKLNLARGEKDAAERMYPADEYAMTLQDSQDLLGVDTDDPQAETLGLDTEGSLAKLPMLVASQNSKWTMYCGQEPEPDEDVDCDGPFTTERAAYDVCKEVPSKRRKKKEDCVSPHSLTNDESFDLIGENITGVVTEGTYRKLEATRSPDVNPPQSHRPYRQEEISKIKMDIGRFGADNGGTANLPNASSRWSKYLCEQGDTENTSH